MMPDHLDNDAYGLPAGQCPPHWAWPIRRRIRAAIPIGARQPRYHVGAPARWDRVAAARGGRGPRLRGSLGAVSGTGEAASDKRARRLCMKW